MKRIFTLLLACLVALPTISFADDDDDDYGGRRYHREYKEKYWDGPCKVERKYKRNGDYEEKRKCRGRDYDDGYYSSAPSQPDLNLGGVVRLLNNL